MRLADSGLNSGFIPFGRDTDNFDLFVDSPCRITHDWPPFIIPYFKFTKQKIGVKTGAPIRSA
jgi:hypothetical protein